MTGGKRERLTAPIEGGEIALLRLGRRAAPPLLFAHANGFCASAYGRMFAALGDRYDIFAVDLRGHGRTTLPTDIGRHRGMEIFGVDLAALAPALAAEAANAGGWTLAGHSMGAVAVTFAAAGRNDVKALRLIEPVAMPKSLALMARTSLWPLFSRRMNLVKSAFGRRAHWPDRESVRARYAQKALFSGWAAGVLDDYLEEGLRDETGGGVALACAPAWEAANFAAQGHDFWGAVKKAPAPVFVLASRHRSTTAPAFARRRFEKLGATVVVAENATHLLPFEDPARAARFLAGA